MNKLNARLVYWIYTGMISLTFGMAFTINQFYYADKVGLNPLQLILLGTVMEAAIFVFEIPTGIVADVYSRRLSIIIGVVLLGIGTMIVAVPSFPILVAGWVLWGFGYTFTSGATNAWITDEVGEEYVSRIFLRGGQIGSACGLLAIGLSVALASISIALPIVVGGAALVGFGGFLLLFMPETGFAPTPREDRSTWGAMRGTFQDGVAMIRRRPVMITILLITLVAAAWSESYDRLWVPSLLERFTLPTLGNLKPVVWFGIINGIGSVLSIGASLWVERFLDTSRYGTLVRTMMGAMGLMMIAVIGFVLAGEFWLALIAFWLVDITRTVYYPLYQAWINQGLDSQVRATVLSMSGQVDAFGQIIGGPVYGVVANRLSIRVAMLGASLLFIPVLWLFRSTFGHAPVKEEMIAEAV